MTLSASPPVRIAALVLATVSLATAALAAPVSLAGGDPALPPTADATAHAGMIHIRSASVSVSTAANSASGTAQSVLTSHCEGKILCGYMVNQGELGIPGGNRYRLSVDYDCNDGRLRTESLHNATSGAELRLSCLQQPTLSVDNFNGQRTVLLPGFYRQNVNGQNIGAMATPSTSQSPLGFISSALNTYRSMQVVPNPYAELGAVVMNLLSRPSTKYYLPRLAAADGRIVLQMDDGAWCHVRNPTAYSVVDTEWFFTPTSRDDAPKATLPFCPMPDGFYLVPDGSIYFLGDTAPGGRARMHFYNVKFSSGYCRINSVDDQKSITRNEIGLGPNASDGEYTATVFNLGEDGNIGEGRQFMGNCSLTRSTESGWSGAIPPPSWLANPSSDVDHLRRILQLGGDRLLDQLIAMSADDARNTVIVVMSSNSRESVSYYQGLDNRSLAGLAGLRLYIKGVGRSTTSMSAGDIRNTAIADLSNRGRGTVSQFQALDNFALYQAAMP